MLDRIRQLFRRPTRAARPAAPPGTPPMVNTGPLYCGTCDRSTARRPDETDTALVARHRATCPGRRDVRNTRNRQMATPRPPARRRAGQASTASASTHANDAAVSAATNAATTAALAASTAAISASTCSITTPCI